LGGGGGYYAHGRYGGAGLGGVLGLVLEMRRNTLETEEFESPLRTLEEQATPTMNSACPIPASFVSPAALQEAIANVDA
jgi:hypothetical protein